MTMGCSVSPEPSMEVKEATKAMLMDAERRRLPRSLAQTEGVLLRQKNTFFHVELEDYNDNSSLDSSENVLPPSSMDSACSSLLSSSRAFGRFLSVGQHSFRSSSTTTWTPEPLHAHHMDSSSSFLPRLSPPRKQTESSIAMPPSLLTRRSSLVASASIRSHSCPANAPPSPSAFAVSPSPSLLLLSDSPPPLPVRAPPPSDSDTPSPTAVVRLPLLQLLPEYAAAAAAPSSTAPISVVPAAVPVTAVAAGTGTGVGTGGRTTVMLRNVPYHESQTGVLRVLESRGFLGKFDFFYAPLDFASGNNLGYCFINLRTSEAVEEFFRTFDSLRVNADGWAMKQLAVCWARVQGLNANIEQYRNSPVNEMPLHFRPMLFDQDGIQLPFPSPDSSNGNAASSRGSGYATHSSSRHLSSTTGTSGTSSYGSQHFHPNRSSSGRQGAVGGGHGQFAGFGGRRLSTTSTFGGQGSRHPGALLQQQRGHYENL